MRSQYRLNEIEHRYGSKIHLLNDPFATTLLAELCSPKTFQPRINQLVELLYHNLIRAVANVEFEQIKVEVPTRMTAHHSDIFYEGTVFSPEQRIVTVSVARAGLLPSQICYDRMNQLLNPVRVRQDHLLVSRVTDDKEQVQGSQISGHKIGGDVQECLILIPDPMGATGSTIKKIIEHYEKNVPGKAKKYLALNLIVTPEYLRNLKGIHEHFEIYAFRVDRGLSSTRVLSSVPGTHWDEERGLNDKQYIVPGGGGFGEIMNNSFV